MLMEIVPVVINLPSWLWYVFSAGVIVFIFWAGFNTTARIKLKNRFYGGKIKD